MTQIERINLSDELDISRLIIGGWQATAAFGERSEQDLIDTYSRYVDMGMSCFDVADIYPGTERLMGELRARLADRDDASAARSLQVLTKLVPNADAIATLDAIGIEARVDRALELLRAETIDLLQFHWWDYALPGIERFSDVLMKLREKGKIRALGATNFNSRQTTELIALGFAPVTMQIQYSLLDRRAAGPMTQLAHDEGFKLICYGGLAGGLLSGKWYGAREPVEPNTPSLAKYLLVIDAFGGWDAYRALLEALNRIARRHDVDISAVALRWLLDQPEVGAVIVGARSTDYLSTLLRISSLKLTADESLSIADQLHGHPGPTGDTYDLEREPDGILSETALARRSVS